MRVLLVKVAYCEHHKKPGVSICKRFFQNVLAQSGFRISSTCQFRRSSEKSNHLLSSASTIGLKIFTKFQQLVYVVHKRVSVCGHFITLMSGLSRSPVMFSNILNSAQRHEACKAKCVAITLKSLVVFFRTRCESFVGLE